MCIKDLIKSTRSKKKKKNSLFGRIQNHRILLLENNKNIKTPNRPRTSDPVESTRETSDTYVDSNRPTDRPLTDCLTRVSLQSVNRPTGRPTEPKEDVPDGRKFARSNLYKCTSRDTPIHLNPLPPPRLYFVSQTETCRILTLRTNWNFTPTSYPSIYNLKSQVPSSDPISIYKPPVDVSM